MENILPILIAEAPEALIELCGVNLLERLLRILQRLGFRRAIVFSTTAKSTSSTQRRSTITSSPCVGACGLSVFRRHPSRIDAWLSESFSIPPKTERSTFRLISTHRSKRGSSHFFAKRE